MIFFSGGWPPIRVLLSVTGELDPVMFWVVATGFGASFMRSVRGLKRGCETVSDLNLSDRMVMARLGTLAMGLSWDIL